MLRVWKLPLKLSISVFLYVFDWTEFLGINLGLILNYIIGWYKVTVVNLALPFLIFGLH